jgi:hypothetical protein
MGSSGSRARKWTWFLVILIVLAMAVAVAMPVFSSPGGVGDRNLQASDCSFHSVQSSATIGMSASTTTPSPGEQITVSVTVSGGSTSNLMGVALLSKTSGSSGTTPQENGWTIVSDPAGSKFNYVESSYGGSLTDTWNLKAPSTPGSYSLYAKIFHGNRAYVKLFSTGLTLTVAAPLPNAPIVIITAPANGATVGGNMAVTASVTPDTGQTISSVELRLDGVLFGTDTVSPFSWSVPTENYANGAHALNVTAIDGGARKGYSQISVDFNNVPQPPLVTISAPVANSTVSGYIDVIANVTPLGGHTILSVSLRVDGLLIKELTVAPFTWQLDTYLYGSGQHVIAVAATDSSDLVGQAQVQVFIDNRLPTVRFLTPSDGGTVYGTLTIEANATSSTGPPSVILSIDGVAQNMLASPPYAWSWVTTTLTDGNHVLDLSAQDSNGNTSTTSINVTVWNGPPQVILLTPGQGAQLNGSVDVTISIINGPPLNWTRLFLGGELLTELAPGQYNYSLNTFLFNNGIYALGAIAQDSLGREGSAEISVTISNVLASIRIDVSPGTLSGTVDVLVTALGDEPVRNVTLAVDGTIVSTMTAAPYLWKLDTTAFANGPHRLNATAATDAGRSPSDSVAVEFSNEPPAAESFDLTGVDLLVAQILVVVAAIGIVMRKIKGPKVK